MSATNDRPRSVTCQRNSPGTHPVTHSPVDPVSPVVASVAVVDVDAVVVEVAVPVVVSVAGPEVVDAESVPVPSSVSAGVDPYVSAKQDAEASANASEVQAIEGGKVMRGVRMIIARPPRLMFVFVLRASESRVPRHAAASEPDALGS
jgi:hypothetical protein